MHLVKWLKVHSKMGERMTKWLNNSDKTHTKLKGIVQLSKNASRSENNSSLHEDETEPQEGDSPDFPLFPKLSEWAALSSVPSPNCEKVYGNLEEMEVSSFLHQTIF